MKKYLSLLVFSLFLISCSEEDTKGPTIGVVSNNFELIDGLSASDENIDFSATDSVLFSAAFNEEASYKITLTGQESGAFKTIEGLDDTVTAIWNGESELIFFKDEKVDVILTVLGKNDIVDSLEVAINQTYEPEGPAISTMESNTLRLGLGSWFEGDNKVFEDVMYETDVPLEGKFAHYLEGVSLAKPGDQFVGLASMVPKSHNRDGRYFAIPTTNPDSLYFNIFIYGTGDENLAVFVKFMQDDNNNNSHDFDRDNGFEMQLLDLSHIGWKKFSFPYSSVPLGGNTNFGGNGDGIQRPDMIKKIELGIWAMDNPDKAVTLIYDYMIFTKNKPFGE